MKRSAWPESAEGAGERAQALRWRGARQAGGRSGLAQQVGFTISEIRTLLDGFSEDIPPSECWRFLASHDTREPLV
jgi:hypothetical protein